MKAHLPSPYMALVFRVAKVDKEAAHYMVDDVLDLPHFNPQKHLFCCFSWSETPQGFRYWDNIYRQINEHNGGLGIF